MLTVGDIFSTSSYGDLEVVEYVNSGNVKVRFSNTGYEACTTASSIRKGLVKDYLKPSVYFVGFNSAGKRPTKRDNPLMFEAYYKWKEMLRRCYSENFLKDNPTYIGCNVTPLWLDFNNFYNWYLNVRKDYMDSSWNLDKDLLTDYDNKTYSPEFCELVPKELNRAITGVRTNKQCKTTIGVSYCESVGNYRAYCNDAKGDRLNIGMFPSEDLAFEAYCEHKDLAVKTIAQELQGKISDRLFKALSEYKTKRRV
ncbi:HNH endonuclease [Vibrio phage K406]